MPMQTEALNLSRIDRLGRYLDLMSQPDKLDGLALKALYEDYQDLLQTVSPQEVFAAFTQQLEKGQSSGEVLAYLDKIINVLHKGLSQQNWDKPAPGTFLAVLMAENDALLAELAKLRSGVGQNDWMDNADDLLAVLSHLSAVESHYQKKENILFPSLEKIDARFNGLSIMWSLHDRARSQLAGLQNWIRSGESDTQQFRKLAGQLIFTLHGLVIKENLLLYPVVSKLFTTDEQAGMLVQSYEYGFCLIEPPERPSVQPAVQASPTVGFLNLQEAMMMFNHLPVDLTFVDEHNKVRYFNKAKDRFFPRSPAVIGRDVSRCHPAESVHVVESIIDAFRAGRQRSARFWIELKGRMLLIQYFALHDDDGTYRGVLEVSQDVTGIRQLEGQQRLLQWEAESDC